IGCNKKTLHHTREPEPLCAAGTAVALLGLGLVYKNTRPEKKLTQVGVVTQLLVHPMKSGKAVLVETAECLRMG
uniref:Uncharacterized protein n=1 Tax=Sinocyclocheilus rhinocerous TaxID=307959 RepID=A0A673G9Z9_9TELE